MALKDAVATVLNRNAFYRDGYRLLLRITVIQGIVIGVLVLAIATLVLADAHASGLLRHHLGWPHH